MSARLHKARRQELRSASLLLCWRRTDTSRGTAPSLRKRSCCKSGKKIITLTSKIAESKCRLLDSTYGCLSSLKPCVSKCVFSSQITSGLLRRIKCLLLLGINIKLLMDSKKGPIYVSDSNLSVLVQGNNV